MGWEPALVFLTSGTSMHDLERVTGIIMHSRHKLEYFITLCYNTVSEKWV